MKRKLKRFWPFYIMMLPAVVYLFINNYIPMGGLVLAFKNYRVADGIFGSAWCGLDNFKFLFQTKDAWTITRNTLLYNVAFIILGNVCAIAVAIFLNDLRTKRLKKVYQTIILLPYFISIVVVAYLVNAFLAGDLGFINNHILEPLGLESIQFYSQQVYWPFILIFVFLWKNVGYYCILYLATLSGIDPNYYEAAQLDGASKWQQIKNITLPCLKPTMITLFIISVGKIFYSDFGLFYQVPMDSGMLYPVTQTIDTYVFIGLTASNNIGMSAAAGFYQSFVGFILVLFSNMIVRRIDKESAMF